MNTECGYRIEDGSYFVLLVGSLYQARAVGNEVEAGRLLAYIRRHVPAFETEGKPR